MALIGPNCKAYINTGTGDSPTWLELSCLSDMNVSDTWDAAEASSRASRAKRYVKALLDIEITCKALVDPNDAGYAELSSYFYSDTPADILILDGARNEIGAEGWRAGFGIFKSSEDQSLPNALYYDITLKPDANGLVPRQATVVDVDDVGTLTYTDLPVDA